MYYHPVHHELDVFRHCYQNQLAVLLKGPTGCGKSRLVEHMAHVLGRPLVTVACSDETSAADLLGRWLVRGGDTVWQDGPVTRAVRSGAILYLDEVAEAREDVVVVLHPLGDHRRRLFVDRTNEELEAPPEFMLVASFNPGYRRGLKDLKPSTRQRFVAISMGYPEPAIEAAIVQKEASLERGLCDRLVTFARKVRTLSELGLAETVSTRLLVDAARLIVSGLHPRIALSSAVVHPLTDDPETARTMQDIADLMF
jgi:nitric oxide reductase NorQ protein